MNKSDIIRQMGYRLPDLNIVDIDKAVDLLLDMMGQHLAWEPLRVAGFWLLFHAYQGSANGA